MCDEKKNHSNTETDCSNYVQVFDIRLSDYPNCFFRMLGPLHTCTREPVTKEIKATKDAKTESGRGYTYFRPRSKVIDQGFFL